MNDINIPRQVIMLANSIRKAGGRLYIVGGAVRDWQMGIPPIDLDLLIVGLDVTTGLAIMGQPEQVIGNAPVYMWGKTEVAFARRETSIGDGKHGFTFVADATVTLLEDLRRRDFTINSMAIDVLTGTFIDPFGGRHDIEKGLLHPTSRAFVESPERVLRGAAFAARFDFDVTATFNTYARQMLVDFDTIPAEQIWRHWEKMCVHAIKPARWLEVIIDAGWVYKFPVLAQMVGVEQDMWYHPEGDLIAHTCQVMDMALVAAEHYGRDKMVAITAALLHDNGKATTTFAREGRIVSPGHAEAGVAPADSFLTQIAAPLRFKARVLELVKLHMRLIQCESPRSIRRLLADMEYDLLDLLVIVSADHSGRGSDKLDTSMTDMFLERVEQLAPKHKFEPLVMGRDLIMMGLKPSREFGIILSAAADAQIEGVFDNLLDGLEWVKKYIGDSYER